MGVELKLSGTLGSFPQYPKLDFISLDRTLVEWIEDLERNKETLQASIPQEFWRSWERKILNVSTDAHTKIYLVAALMYFENSASTELDIDSSAKLQAMLKTFRNAAADASGDISKLPDKFRIFIQPAAIMVACDQEAQQGGLNLCDEIRGLHEVGIFLTMISNSKINKAIAAILKEMKFGIGPREARSLKPIRKRALDLLQAWGMVFTEDPLESDTYLDDTLLRRTTVIAPAMPEAGSAIPTLAHHIASKVRGILKKFRR